MPGLILYLAGSAVLGMGLCFAGKRHYPLLLGILTFFSVCSARAAVDGAMSAGTLLAALAAGALTGLCARFFYKAGVFLTCALIGAGLGGALAACLPAASLSAYLPAAGLTGTAAVMAAVMAVAAGVLSLFWSDVLLMLSTSLSGAAMLSAPLCLVLFEGRYLLRLADEAQGWTAVGRLETYLSGGAFADAHAIVLLAVTGVLALAGFLRQMAAEKD